ncbi:MAG: type I methionyl aminopeptidase [Chloroflexi bacterium]|nr:type I methionyl aminopeptidase [Chloroflexota bacterium]
MHKKGVINTANPPAPRGVTIKSPQEIDLMRQAGRVVASVLDLLVHSVQPGMRTRELDTLAAREVKRLGAKPAFLGYRGFPATICVSLNEEIVHGIPGERSIKEGDLVKLDVGAVVGGMYGDAAATVVAGKAATAAQALVETTREALGVGIRATRAGARIGDIGAAIEAFVQDKGYWVVREYVGHGIGQVLHEDPQVPNYGVPGRGPLLRPGMTIAIEPMVNIGTWRTRVLGDGWTVVTADASLSAHFEHTLLVGQDGAEILTVA